MREDHASYSANINVRAIHVGARLRKLKSSQGRRARGIDRSERSSAADCSHAE